MTEVPDSPLFLVLPSIHYVMKLEESAKKKGWRVDLIPTPREISTDCGMVLKFENVEPASILALAAESSSPEGEIYVKDENGYRRLGATMKFTK